MGERGRKSAAELTAMPGGIDGLPQRPEPPITLDERGQKRWREIVNALPADYWRPSDLGLLEELVLQEGFIIECDELIAEHGRLIPGSTGNLVSNPAVAQRNAHLKNIISIQRTLRLPPSTRYDKQSAKLGKSTARKRPWEA